MCIIFLAYRCHPKYGLITAANRDEFYKRPTEAAHFWKDELCILAGRDLEQMGTWMGVTRTGRFAALTNYRNPAEFEKKDKQSRGHIVRSFLAGTETPLEFLTKLQQEKSAYKGFNLFVADEDNLMYYSNIEDQIKKLSPGIYGLSNELLDTPWPKVEKGKQQLKQLLDHDLDPECLFKILADSDPAPEELLPQTGIPLDLEKTLSSIFIESPDYGTRCSTVLTIDKGRNVHFIERTFPQAEGYEKEFTFQLEGS
ncbi:NRDE family protein [Siminovitchia acidinfaciens]|uniref:NRDE family protein n=1 Tax=Siminovitchia acidinfaciens TaxID=2321395 RepID=A0A429Y4H8_9BACI|nr:NRDE family protein [Siminovitchia acidinfaciens]RST76311.1 NRDE family protein [Siminovitchia acidinfaciens]